MQNKSATVEQPNPSNPHYPYITQPTDKPSEEPSKKTKWLINGTAGLFGLAATICGFFACFCIGLCTFGGVLLILSGLLVIALEVPIICGCLTFIEPLAKFSRERKNWQKILLYFLLPIPSIAMNQTAASIVGFIFVVGVGFIYFYLLIRR